MLANADKHTNHYLMQVAQNTSKMRKKNTNLVKRGRVITDGHKWGVDGHRWMGGHRRAGKRALWRGTEGHGEARMCMCWPLMVRGKFPMWVAKKKLNEEGWSGMAECWWSGK